MDWQTFPHEADVGVRGTGPSLAEAFAGAVAEEAPLAYKDVGAVVDAANRAGLGVKVAR